MSLTERQTERSGPQMDCRPAAKERSDMRFSYRRISMMLAVTFSIGLVAMSLAVVAGGQTPTEREGKCELAEQLFPNHNPGPESLKRVAVPEPTNLAAYVRNRDVAI